MNILMMGQPKRGLVNERHLEELLVAPKNVVLKTTELTLSSGLDDDEEEAKLLALALKGRASGVLKFIANYFYW